jgi:hypothetical protein
MALMLTMKSINSVCIAMALPDGYGFENKRANRSRTSRRCKRYTGQLAQRVS